MIRFFLLISFFAVLVNYSGTNLFAQYSLPSSSVLVSNSVCAVHVYKKDKHLEEEDRSLSKSKKLDQTPHLLTTYFIGVNGRIDSLYRYYNDSHKYEKTLFSFDREGSLWEFKTVKPNGQIDTQTILEKTPNFGKELRRYNQNILTSYLKINEDGVIIESKYFQCFKPKSVYVKTYWDLETKTKTESVYENDTLIREEAYHWVTNKDVPTQFVYKQSKVNKPHGDMFVEQQEYYVDKDGSILSENKGLFTDPFHSYNYYNWYSKFEGIVHPYENWFRLNTLVKEQEYKEIIDFKGTSLVSAYLFKYDFN